MAVDLHFLLAILAMAVASFACRVTGYFLMGYVPITPRVQGALKAIPLGVMIGIVMPSVLAGKVPEMVGLVVVFAAMKLTGKDVVAALAGAGAVGICRSFGL
ncbi:AzlD family protein [Ramlibacter pallidus]|uniref:AzlD domain-containing protein n=1 Tax=Ramlibacter pallidus TaxID=2780087 RepID=A0ABR9S6U0_9BURK|nr:AzlD domain-containing protein [Ramlibacter pallidus]MBE7369231.1 AzlD domain-containing protein [Ramlibacter pallidus]